MTDVYISEAIKAKYYGQGQKFGRAEFDRLLGDFDAGADVPFATFGTDLIEAYPDAKVILNTRDVDSWLGSMRKTAGAVLAWPSWKYVAPWDPTLVGPWWEFAQWIMVTRASLYLSPLRVTRYQVDTLASPPRTTP